MEAGRTAPRVRMALIAVAAAVITLFPLAALDEPRPTFLGWHMYSAVVYTPTIAVTLADGSTTEVLLSSIAARVRPEIDYTDAVATFVCERTAGAITVRLERAHPPLVADVSCATL